MCPFPFREMLEIALERVFAVGYFEAWNEDSIEAVIEGGEETKNSLIIGFGAALVNQSWFNGWGLECCAAMGRIAVEKARIPVAFILNEAHILGQGMRGIKLGFNVIMIHTSNLSKNFQREVFYCR